MWLSSDSHSTYLTCPVDAPPHDPSHNEWATIDFPSDRVTLGALRRMGTGSPEDVEVLVHNLIVLEQDLARSYLLSDPESPESREVEIRKLLRQGQGDELADLYVKVGLASGPREAQLLVTEFRSALAAMGSRPKRGRD